MKSLYIQYIESVRVIIILTFCFLTLAFTAIGADEIDCSGLSEWEASAVYTGGAEVQYNGNKYRANYWTQNNNPEEYSDPYEHWTNLGACDGGGDNASPFVNISQPLNGATFTAGGNVLIEANASDSDGNVVKVEFYSGSTKLGEDTSAPFNFTWGNVAAGSYSLTAKATDNEGAFKTSVAVAITVSQDGDGGSCSGLPQYSAGTSYSQDQEVQNVNQKFRCDVPGWCSSSAAWAYEPGVGMYWQEAWTYLGDCDSDAGGNDDPSVTISSPLNGSSFVEGANITITANASDDEQVAKVEFYRNGAKIGEDLSSPYEVVWSNAAIGSYSLTAKATDDEGASTTSSAISVTVRSDDDGGDGDLPKRLLVGYWHNFDNGSGTIKLRNVSDKWDVINIAFAEPTAHAGSTMQFTPDPAIYPNVQEFKDDVALLRSRGKKVLISIGGANGAIDVSSATDAQNFSSSMINIINTYGFSGMDIDLEGSSLSLVAGDTDFRNPVSPKITYFISATKTVLSNYGSDFILSMAPETAFVQGGHSTYSGIYGAYLPVIYALRDQMDYIHVQHYNSGCMVGLDGRCYSQSTPDFHVAMAEMLLQGFSVAGNPASFPALRPDQVAIGLPASPSAAGGGYTTPTNVHKALDYLIKGVPFGGSYTLRNSNGYFDFRGLMTWSINWDIANGYEFSNNHRAYLDALDGASMARIASATHAEKQIEEAVSRPNPFVSSTMIHFTVQQESFTSLVIYNTVGKKVAVLADGLFAPGHHALQWNAEQVPTGIYFFRLTSEGKTTTYKMYKE